MHYAIKVSASFATAAARNAARTALLSESTPGGFWSQVTDAAFIDMDDPLRQPRYVYLRRLLVDGELDDLRNRIATRFAQLPDGAHLQVHKCFHDENPPSACIVVSEWVRQNGQTVRTI